MKLFTTPNSPYGRKLRVMLDEKRIGYELVMVDLNDLGNPVRAINPLAKVPSFLADDGEAYFDSMMIAEMIDAMPGQRLIPEPPLRWAAMRIAALAQGMT